MTLAKTGRVSVIVVSYNTCEMTLACLQSLFDQTLATEIEVIVVDNASVDGSCDRIEQRFGTRARVIQSGSNLGFAAGTNLGAHRANGEFILLLNPDTIVQHGAVDRLVEFARANPGAGVWGGKTVFPDGSLNPGYCWAPPTLWSLTSQAIGLTSLLRNSSFFNPEAVGVWNRASVREVPVVSGCFFLITRAAWEKLGGFDERFFMYGEEVDLCLRASKQLGFRPMVTQQACIMHYGGASETVRSDMLTKLIYAKAQLVRKHFRRAAQPFALVLLTSVPLTRHLGHRVLARFGRAASEPQANAWREVYQRRRSWL